MTSPKRETMRMERRSMASTIHSLTHSARQIAVLRLHLPDGSVHSNQLLTLDENGNIISHAPLHKEVAFCEWFRGDWYCKEE